MKEIKNIDFLIRKWPTKFGYFFTVVTVTSIILGLATEARGAGFQITSMALSLFILVFLVAHHIVWNICTGRVALCIFNKIRVAVHSSILNDDNNLEKVLKSSIKNTRTGCSFDIFILPEDLVIDNNMAAERFVIERKFDLLIWGNTISGTELGKGMTQYRLAFSYAFNYPVNQPNLKLWFSKSFDPIIKERYWLVNKENSLKDIILVGENIVEVGLYVVSMCLLSRGYIKVGLTILEDLFEKIKNDSARNKSVLCEKIRNHLISLYNLLSVIAWREEENKEKSLSFVKKVLVLDENNYDCHLRLALYEYQQGNISGMRAQIKRCRKIDPHHPCTLFDQAFLFILDKKYDKALKQYKKLESAQVDGLLAFEVANFLEEEYRKNTNEIAFLFAAGFVNYCLVVHNEIGLIQLEEFCELAKNRVEYSELSNKAQALITINRLNRDNK